jgi:hypothetical protein
MPWRRHRQQEAVLELGLARVEVVEELPQQRAPAALQRITDGEGVEQAAELRLTHHALEGLLGEALREVDERAGG